MPPTISGFTLTKNGIGGAFAPLGSSLWALVPAGMIYGFFQFGMYASFGPYFTELFPTELRGTGQAFACSSLQWPRSPASWC